MPVRVSCPHCHTPCLVAEQHQGVPVKCGRCGRTFTTRADPRATVRIEPPGSRLRLDIGAATAPTRSRQAKEDSYLVHRLVRCNLAERHEWAVLVVANDSRVIPATAAALTPLLDRLESVSANDVVKTLAASCSRLCTAASIAVIHEDRVALSRVGQCPVYHHSGGRLNRLRDESLRLAAGDWLLLASQEQPSSFAAVLPAEIATARCSAVELAQRLVQRVGQDACTIVAVHGIRDSSEC